MSHLLRAVIAMFALLPSVLQAQHIDRTAPGPYSYVTNGGFALDYNQTFLPRYTAIERITIWFRGGTYDVEGSPWQEDQYARFWLWEGDATSGEPWSSTLFTLDLDHHHEGRLDIHFADPLMLTALQAHTFTFFVNNCGPIAEGGCGEWGYAPGDVYRDPAIQVSSFDAYAPGHFWTRFDPVDDGRDIRFEIQYAVSEPLSAWLLGSGLVAAALVGHRKRRTRGA